MPKLSLNAASEEASKFFRREAGILLPVAFATFGLGMLLIAMVTPEPVAGKQVEPGAWMLALIPVILAALLGQLAISLLVLRPGTSVSEALRSAAARLPKALLVALLLMLIAFVGLIVIALVLVGLGVATGASTLSLTVLTALLLAVGLVWLGARALPIWPLLADRGGGAVRTLRSAFALTKGNTARLVAALVAFGLVYVIVTGALQLVFGSLFLLVGKAIGSEGVGRFLAELVVAIAASVLQALWAVFVTYLYRGTTAVAPTTGS